MVSKTRVAIAVPGVALLLFGVFRLLTEIPNEDLVELAVWLVAAVVLHDGVLSPLLLGLGWILERTVPPRGRAFVQGGLIAGMAVTVVAIPMIYRGDVQPSVKGILRQNYALNLAVALVLVLLATSAAYLTRALRGQRPSTAKLRPSADQDSITE